MSTNTLFLSGLPYTSNEEDILKFLEGCGEILEVKMPRYQDSGKSRGYAHVTFKDSEAAQKALETKNKGLIGTRYVIIQLAKGQKPEVSNADALKKKKRAVPGNCTTIFVKNLPYDCTEDEVGDFFAKFGKIENVRFAIHPVLKHFKGFCYIDFKLTDAVKGAMRMDGCDFKGRKIKVDFEMGNPKSSYKPQLDSETNTKYNKEVKKLLHKKTIRKQKKDKHLSIA